MDRGRQDIRDLHLGIDRSSSLLESWLLFHRLRDEVSQSCESVGDRGLFRLGVGICSYSFHAGQLSHILNESIPFHLLELLLSLHRTRSLFKRLVLDNVDLTVSSILFGLLSVRQRIGQRVQVSNELFRCSSSLRGFGIDLFYLGHEGGMLDGALVLFRGTELIFKNGAPSTGRFLRGRLPLSWTYGSLLCVSIDYNSPYERTYHASGSEFNVICSVAIRSFADRSLRGQQWSLMSNRKIDKKGHMTIG